MGKTSKKIMKGVGIAIFAVLAIFAFGYCFQLLWNWLIPDLFNGPVITFWQGMGLILLGKLIVGGRPGGGCKCKKSKWKKKKEYWTKYKNSEDFKQWKESCKTMSEEEKNEMKQKMKEKFFKDKNESEEC